LGNRLLPALLLVYAAASLIHFTHNAEFLADYPNMPGWITRGGVYAVWLAQTTLGAAGYVLHRRAFPRLGLAVIALYAALGFDGLAHYVLAPLTHHTTAMNITIWLEVTVAAALFAFVARAIAKGQPC
jgi:hypothetical protein